MCIFYVFLFFCGETTAALKPKMERWVQYKQGGLNPALQSPRKFSYPCIHYIGLHPEKFFIICKSIVSYGEILQKFYDTPTRGQALPINQD